jgi:hypothetical protein
MKHYTVLLRLLRVEPLPRSVNGNPRWRFHARTCDGPMQKFKTATDAGSAYACNLSRLKGGDAIRARFHTTATGTLMVDRWGDGRSSGEDLSSQFDALELQRQIRADLPDPQTTPSNSRL